MAFLTAAKSLLARFRLWARHHGGELLWAALFAIVFGVPLALYFAKYFIDLPPYKIYVVAGSHYLTKSANLERDTEFQFRSSPELSGLNVDGVPVQLEVVPLKDDEPETARSMARYLVGKSDTLLVIGHLDSEPTEKSLPTYFKARPQVPFIASVQTDDNLLNKALLVKDCEGPNFTCYDGLKSLPYLQLSPTNKEQAHWAVQFAAQNHRHHFLIVESDTSNATYSKSLADDYKKAIDELILSDPDVKKYFLRWEELTRKKLGEDLPDEHIDCVLYAGGLDDAPLLLNRIVDAENDGKGDQKLVVGTAAGAITVILDDSVVEDRLERTKFDVSRVNITNQTDAEDYRSGISVYGLDAVAIAAQLVKDLSARGLDFNYRLKAFFRLQNGTDVRRNLVRVMQDNFIYRSSYFGATRTAISPNPRTVYAFEQYTRSNGMFHVWERTGFRSDDVDRWHPPRTSPVAALPQREKSKARAELSVSEPGPKP
jgi:hypothetical protein